VNHLTLSQQLKEATGTVEVLLTDSAFAMASQIEGCYVQDGYEFAVVMQGQGEIGLNGTVVLQADGLVDEVAVSLQLAGSLQKKAQVTIAAKEVFPKQLSFALSQLDSPLQCVEGSADLAASLFFSGTHLDRIELLPSRAQQLRLYDSAAGRVLFAEQMTASGPVWPNINGLHVAMEHSEYIDVNVQLKQRILEAKSKAVKDRIEWTLTGADLAIEHPHLVFKLPTFGDKGALVVLEKGGEISKASLDLEEGMMQWRARQLSLEHLSGQLAWTPQGLTLSQGQAMCHGISVCAEASLDADAVLDVTTSSIQGSLADVCALAQRVGALSRPLPALDAQVSSGPKGCALHVPLHHPSDVAWQCRATVSHLQFPVNESTRVEEGKFDLVASSSSHAVSIEKGQGQWRLRDGSSLNCTLRQMTFHLTDETHTEFCLKLAAARKEVARLEGSLQGQWDQGWVVTFDPHDSHLVDVRLALEPLQISAQGAFKEIELRPQLSLERLPALMTWCHHMGFLPSFNAHAVDRMALKGHVQARVVVDGSQEIQLFAQSSDVQIQGQRPQPLHLELRSSAQQWIVDALQLGELSLKTIVVPSLEGWNLPQFEGGWHGVAFKGSGYFKSKEEKGYGSFESINCDLSQLDPSLRGTAAASAKFVIDFSEAATELFSAQAQLYARVDGPFACVVRHDKPLLISYSSAQGIKLGDVRVVCLEPGWDSREFFLEQIQCFYDAKGVNLRLKTYLEEEPLWASLQLKTSQGTHGVLRLLDHPKAQGLQVQFNDAVIESIDGSCYGLECHLHSNRRQKIQKGYALFGNISVNMGQLQRLFSESARKSLLVANLGNGYSWTGDVIFFNDRNQPTAFKGTLHGKEFEALGYRFEEMKAAISGNMDKIQLTSCHVKEAAASIDIPSCTITRNQGEYRFDVPSVQLQRIQPSALRKIGAASPVLKPFKIEKFSLSNLSGTFGKVETFQADGSLIFSNQFKKEASLFDLPLELIRKMGLDLRSLTPVKGSIDVQLRADKFYLLSLQNAVSEAERAHFYLLPTKEPSYIDLNGNVHIDLKMQQETMLKMIQPFTLTVRGTLDKPRYGLQL
jgi:hypothetical protein